MKRLMYLGAIMVVALTGTAYSHDGVPDASTGFGQPLSVYNATNGYAFMEWSSISGCYHPGADYNGTCPAGGDCDLGLDVLAVANGKVVDIFNNSSFGLCMAIEHHYYDTTIYSQYAHLQSVLVSIGDNVNKGDHVAELGNSGTSCGEGNAHLHWEIRIGGSGKHPEPHNADYWNKDGYLNGFQSRTNIKDWYHDAAVWCGKMLPYSDIQSKFADVVQRNGGSGSVGTSTNGIHWYGPYLRQDYSGGSYGNCCIMYDPYNQVYNPDATDEAYLLRTGFYSAYFAGGGWQHYGCPSRDEYHPESGATNDAIQFFVRREWDATAGEYHDIGKWKTEFHYMYFEAVTQAITWHSSYATAWVSQDPPAQFTMQRGATRQVTVKFRNESEFTWYNNGSSYPYNYVTLKSVNSSGNITESFFNYPYDGSLGWIDTYTACTMQESSVAPGQTATFTFNVKVRSDAPLGVTQVYFRPYHSTGGLLNDWGYMNFHVNVTTATSGGTLADLSVLYDYGSCLTKAHTFTSTGTTFNPFTIWREQSDFCLSAVKHTVSGDFNGDGLDDIAMAYQYADCEMALHLFLSTGSGYAYAPNWWHQGGYCLYAIEEMVAGDFDGDGDDDIATVYDYGGNHTRIHTFYSTGSSFVSNYSSWIGNGWYDANAVIHMVSGDFNGNGKDDIVLSYRTGEYNTSLHVFLSTSTMDNLSFAYQGAWWSSTGFGLDYVPYMVSGDFNGDGKADIITAYRYGQYSTAFHAFLSTGGSFTYSTYWFWADGWYGIDYVKHLVAGDFTGDGKTDLAAAYQYGTCDTRIQRFVSTGSAMFYEGIKWQSTGYCLYAAKYMVAGQFNSGAAAKTATEAGDGILPQQFVLSQNYPNPFNPVTTISYSLPEATHVTIEVFNILGQRVATLVNQQQDAGQHVITWDADQYASGIYFYRLMAGEAVETKKMLLLK